MKLLITAPTFYPTLGGISEVTDIVAQQVHERGHEVTVVTPTLADADAEHLNPYVYRVVRTESAWELFSLARQADQIWMSGFNVKQLLPLLPLTKKLKVTHHTYVQDERGHIGFKE